MASRTAAAQPGRFAYDGLERALHEKARVGIMTALAAAPGGLTFSSLRAQCTLSDGNLSRHLDVLRTEGLIEIWKGFAARRPQTVCRITADGRRRFARYLDELERVVRDARPRLKAKDPRRPLPAGFVLAP